MASNNIARLGVVLGIDTASFTADVDKAIAENKKLSSAIKRDSNAAAGALADLTNATNDYGKTLSRVELIQREVDSGRFMHATDDLKKRLVEQAKAYDAIATSQKKVTNGMNEQQKLSLMYQTTDLFTQIASGGNPLIAFIQQGGQFKDQMGGFSNAFKVLSDMITPFRVGMALAASSIAAVGLAFYQGSEESKKFTNSLALTNGFAGVTLYSFDKLSESISNKFNVAIGDARTIFQSLFSSGSFTYKSLDSVAGAIARISQLSGESVDVISSKLIPSLDGTASSAKRLNEQYHFLNIEQYKQIEALQQQGKTQEAIKLTTDLLTDSLEGQGKQLGYIEKMWRGVKNSASDFWDWAKSIGRDVDPNVTALKNQKAVMDSMVSMWGQAGTKSLKYQTALAEYERIKKLIEADEQEARAKADKKAKDALGISDYSATGGAEAQKKLAIENERIKYKAAIEAAKTTATEEQRIGLDASVKMMDKIFDYRMQSEQQMRVNGSQIQKNMIAEISEFQAERDRKISDERYKEYQKELDAQIAAMKNEEAFQHAKDQAQVAYVEKNYLAYKTVEETQKAERDILSFKLETLGYTEKEIELRKIDIELARQRALIAANSSGQTQSDINEAYRLANAIATQKRETVELADTYRQTEIRFQSVWGNMSSAIDNFVRTGKLNMKDFARSVIQDLIAIQLKAATLSFLKMFMNAGVPSNADVTIPMQPGGGYADGGDPPLGKVSIVGERGPELFIPKTAGTIIPNHALSNMGGTTNITNNYINAIDTKSFEERLLGSSTAIWAANKYGEKSLATTYGRT
ncbi:Bacteriophage lambda, GpH, tail tape measure, N-terminal [uncultured Caudovirales phage]|uniref:Bacteriophage lambda, GpH, tail tape measure, N-terminal n=1 Tax=uncultured Caudovirales phage TaxID=2100421 RepID=A0A6J7XMS0_9CAUD|nr:Bacteriophage lambda, GpH, tail tape measure, N-terminal [uncultured Caudovirales phage]